MLKKLIEQFSFVLVHCQGKVRRLWTARRHTANQKAR